MAPAHSRTPAVFGSAPTPRCLEPGPKVRLKPLRPFTPRQAKLKASFPRAQTIPVLRDIAIGMPAPTQVQVQVQVQVQ